MKKIIWKILFILFVISVVIFNTKIFVFAADTEFEALYKNVSKEKLRDNINQTGSKGQFNIDRIRKAIKNGTSRTFITDECMPKLKEYKPLKNLLDPKNTYSIKYCTTDKKTWIKVQVQQERVKGRNKKG